MRRRLAIVAVLALAACTLGPDYTPPRLPLAPAYRAATGPVPDAAPWWTMFHDPTLDALEAKALAGNLTIEAALARLDQARAAARGAMAAQLPAGALDAHVVRDEQSQNAGLGALSRYVPLFSQFAHLPPSAGLSRTVNDYAGDVGANWDVDFADGLRRQTQAARADAAGAAAGVAAARLAVSADLADAYVAWRGAAAQLAQASALVEILHAQTGIMVARQRLGAAAPSAVEQARAPEAAARAGLPLLTATRDAEANRIAVLLGQPPSLPIAELAGAALVPAADRFGAGVPADLLRYRPDLAIAEARLRSANARIGAALSEYYPRLTLSALLGLDSASLGSLASGSSLMAWGGGALHWRLFDFGRVDAEVKAARGGAREALADYREAVLEASEQVESGFARAQASEDRAQSLRARRAALERAADSAAGAYRLGGVSHDALLTTQAAALNADLDRLAAETDAARAAIAARRALGH